MGEYLIESIKENGFWFVDIPRTSSSSVKAELGKQFGKAYGKVNVLEKQHSTPQIVNDHTPGIAIRDIVGKEIWDSIFKFSIVRNPWDRIFSQYHYRTRTNQFSGISFRDYVLKLAEAEQHTNLFGYHGSRYGACDYLTDEDGKMMMDFVAKYESRESDLTSIARKIDFKKLGQLHIQQAAPNNAHYSDFYQPDTRDIIARRYKNDIEHFEYQFETE